MLVSSDGSWLLSMLSQGGVSSRVAESCAGFVSELSSCFPLFLASKCIERRVLV
jgi:hypothetical protein